MSDAGEAILRLAQHGIESFNNGGLDEFFATAHPEIVLVTDPVWPDGGTYRGIEEFRGFIAQFREAFSEVRFELEREAVAVGDAALFRGAWVGTGVASGISATSPSFSIVFYGREGLIGEAHFLFRDEDARALIAKRAGG